MERQAEGAVVSELEPDSLRELQTLRRAMRRSSGSFAFFVVVGLPGALKEAGRTMRGWSDDEPPELHLYPRERHAELIDRLSLPSGEWEPLPSLVVQEADALMVARTPIHMLNMARDVLDRLVAGPLVLFLSPSAASDLAAVAPDLHDVRSGTYALYKVGEQAPPSDEILRVGGPRDPLPEVISPSALLHARFGVMPFSDRARERELASLQAWCAKEEPLSIRLLTGPAGIGKTRLLLEFSERYRQQGWRAGFLPSGSWSFSELYALADGTRPTLIVVDYAEARPTLADELSTLSERRRGSQPIRVVLLAREVSDWWRLLLEKYRCDSSEIDPDVMELSPLRLEGELRSELFEEARARFAEELENSGPPDESFELDDPAYGNLLHLQAAALYSVMVGGSAEPDEVLDKLLDVEERLYLDEDRLGARRVVAAFVLRGGADSQEEAVRVARLVEGPRGALSFVERLAVLYPSDAKRGSYLSALEPDLLGETLLLRVLRDPSTPGDYLEPIFEGASAETQRWIFLVLVRATLRAPEEASRWLRRALEGSLLERAEPAFDAALALTKETAHAPLASLLAQMLEGEDATHLARRFDGRIPWDTVSFRELAVWVDRSLLPLEKEEGRRAKRLLSLGKRHSDLGRREEALNAAQEATDIRRGLAQQRPDAFLPHLAMSLNNLGNHLSELGQREEALGATQEATDIRRRLAQQRPDAFLPDLAHSLNNLGNRLSELGQREEALKAAQEATDIRRRLAQQRPDAFLPDLAHSLNNLGNSLSDLGQREEALKADQEATDIRRRLAQQRPDAFLPDLAASLNNLGNSLSELGQREEALKAAQEATDIRRRLAQQRPDAFLPNLAVSLNNLGLRLSELGQREEALKAAQEATDIRRRLAQQRPDAFLPDLAVSLNNLGAMLSNLGQGEKALKAAQEAVSVLWAHFERHPAAFGPWMTIFIRNYLKCLGDADPSPEMADRIQAFEEWQKSQE